MSRADDRREIHQGARLPRHQEESDAAYAERTGLHTHADVIRAAQELAHEKGLDGDPGPMPELPELENPLPSEAEMAELLGVRHSGSTGRADET